jgi:hypothetical protein
MNKMEKFDQGKETLETDNAPSEYDASLREQVDKDVAISSGLKTTMDPPHIEMLAKRFSYSWFLLSDTYQRSF